MREVLKVLVVFVLVALIFSGIGVLWWQQSLKPVDPGNKTFTLVVIKKGSSGAAIARQLRLANLIKSQKAFLLYLKLHPQTLKAGTFRLGRGMSLEEIVTALHHGPLDVWLTFPEGWRLEEMTDRLAKTLTLKFNKKEFLRLTAPLEGYLFPDTYLIPVDADAQKVVKIMNNNFQVKALPLVKQAAAKQKLTVQEVVTLASLIEREGKSFADKKLIASILLKRLKNNWPLQVDATLQYIKGRPGNWWPKVSREDKKIKSPFNTYLHKGLPPHPIANPGLNSFRAVYQADPETPYWFYITDKNGHLKPVRTLEEHQKNIERYLK